MHPWLAIDLASMAELIVGRGQQKSPMVAANAIELQRGAET
jgi:hypothetical protein